MVLITSMFRISVVGTNHLKLSDNHTGWRTSYVKLNGAVKHRV
jgi:hypothetical protein